MCMNSESSAKNLPFISVVTAAYNEEKYLPACLKALQNQTYPKDRYSYTIVNNNSTDATATIAKEYGAEVLHEEKQGYVYTLSHGMNTVKGDIIAVTDADTVVPASWLEQIAVAFEDPKVVAITGGARLTIPSSFFADIMEGLFTVFLTVVFGLGRSNVNGFNFAVRREVFLKAGGLNTRYTMSPDVELGIRMTSYGKVVYIKDLIVQTSSRRWKKGYIRALWDYSKAFITTTFFHSVPEVQQEVIR